MSAWHMSVRQHSARFAVARRATRKRWCYYERARRRVLRGERMRVTH